MRARLPLVGIDVDSDNAMVKSKEEIAISRMSRSPNDNLLVGWPSAVAASKSLRRRRFGARRQGQRTAPTGSAVVVSQSVESLVGSGATIFDETGQRPSVVD
jgi:hypothetical protein